MTLFKVQNSTSLFPPPSTLKQGNGLLISSIKTLK